MLRVDAIDESHVKAGECPCHGRIELRTLHKNLPESRRTLCARPFPAEFGPTLADFSTLDSTNFPHIHARHLLTQPFVASLRATTYMLRWTGVNRRAGSASHAAPLMRGPCGRCSPGQIVWWPASRVVGRQTFTIRIVFAPAMPRKTFMQVILRAMRGASLCAAGGCRKGTHPVE